ncbi:MAG: hypothetical protein AAF411_03225 [Myxococcota bacterium]
MIRTLLMLGAASAAACGGSQTRSMELRSSEQVQIAGILGCNDYDIEETGGDGVGGEVRIYAANCDGGEVVTIKCVTGVGCERN